MVRLSIRESVDLFDASFLVGLIYTGRKDRKVVMRTRPPFLFVRLVLTSLSKKKSILKYVHRKPTPENGTRIRIVRELNYLPKLKKTLDNWRNHYCPTGVCLFRQDSYRRHQKGLKTTKHIYKNITEVKLGNETSSLLLFFLSFKSIWDFTLVKNRLIMKNR